MKKSVLVLALIGFSTSFAQASVNSSDLNSKLEVIWHGQNGNIVSDRSSERPVYMEMLKCDEFGNLTLTAPELVKDSEGKLSSNFEAISTTKATWSECEESLQKLHDEGVDANPYNEVTFPLNAKVEDVKEVVTVNGEKVDRETLMITVSGQTFYSSHSQTEGSLKN